MKKVAVVLCGSGFLDGSEIRESVGVLWALDAHDAEFQCFAPDANQSTVMNCLTREQTAEKRNMVIESARIARSKILPLSQYQASEFDGLVIPGGFGVAKNLCSFALEGSQGKVEPAAQRAIQSTFEAKKPILAVCIAPALVGLSLKSSARFEFTFGSAGETSAELEKLGHRHVVRKADEYCIDRQNRIVTTPAYMYEDARLRDIFKGIDGAIGEFLAL